MRALSFGENNPSKGASAITYCNAGIGKIEVIATRPIRRSISCLYAAFHEHYLPMMIRRNGDRSSWRRSKTLEGTVVPEGIDQIIKLEPA